VTREGLEPSRLGGHGLLRTACLPFHHLAIDEQWTVEGVEPSSAGCRPTVFPLDDTPRIKSSGLAGNRTLNLDFKRVLLCQLSYKAIRVVCRAGVEPPASLLLEEGGLPVAYRATIVRRGVKEPRRMPGSPPSRSSFVPINEKGQGSRDTWPARLSPRKGRCHCRSG
jgi:hypothetical protein